MNFFCSFTFLFHQDNNNKNITMKDNYSDRQIFYIQDIYLYTIYTSINAQNTLSTSPHKNKMY